MPFRSEQQRQQAGAALRSDLLHIVE